MNKAKPEVRVRIRVYKDADRAGVLSLFRRINLELAPADMRERFEQYISEAITGELSRLGEIFSPAKRNAFWVVTSKMQIIGMFGIESCNHDTTELRRMYLDYAYRGQGIAQRMLHKAERHARKLGFSEMILSTAEIQQAAVAFYRKSGFELVNTGKTDSMSTKAVGGGLIRYNFRKLLRNTDDAHRGALP